MAILRHSVLHVLSSATSYTVMLSVIMRSVVMLNVVAPPISNHPLENRALSLSRVHSYKTCFCGFVTFQSEAGMFVANSHPSPKFQVRAVAPKSPVLPTNISLEWSFLLVANGPAYC
jgi:hypothetical protein